MKKLIYRTINKLGYNIYNKRKKDYRYEKNFEKFDVTAYKDLLAYSHLYVSILDKNFKDLQIEDAENGLRVIFSNLEFHVESREEFLILCEIYVDQEYKFITKKECVVIDIGANVGMASIYFSQFDFVRKIYLFEPVKDTFHLAKRNIKNNEIIKIAQFNNFGLGAEDREEEFLFSREVKGNSGIRGRLSPSYKNRKNVETRKVNIMNAPEILEPIINSNEGKQIVVKIDCEGAEYEIIESLKNRNLLRRIDVIMLEWHDHGAETIENILQEESYMIFSRNLGSISGMIHAVRKK